MSDELNKAAFKLYKADYLKFLKSFISNQDKKPSTIRIVVSISVHGIDRIITEFLTENAEDLEDFIKKNKFWKDVMEIKKELKNNGKIT